MYARAQVHCGVLGVALAKVAVQMHVAWQVENSLWWIQCARPLTGSYTNCLAAKQRRATPTDNEILDPWQWIDQKT